MIQGPKGPKEMMENPTIRVALLDHLDSRASRDLKVIVLSGITAVIFLLS